MYYIGKLFLLICPFVGAINHSTVEFDTAPSVIQVAQNIVSMT